MFTMAVVMMMEFLRTRTYVDVTPTAVFGYTVLVRRPFSSLRGFVVASEPCEKTRASLRAESSQNEAAQTSIASPKNGPLPTSWPTRPGVQAWWMQGVVCKDTANGITPNTPGRGGSKRMVTVSFSVCTSWIQNQHPGLKRYRIRYPSTSRRVNLMHVRGPLN